MNPLTYVGGRQVPVISQSQQYVDQYGQPINQNAGYVHTHTGQVVIPPGGHNGQPMVITGNGQYPPQHPGFMQQPGTMINSNGQHVTVIPSSQPVSVVSGQPVTVIPPQSQPQVVHFQTHHDTYPGQFDVNGNPLPRRMNGSYAYVGSSIPNRTLYPDGCFVFNQSCLLCMQNLAHPNLQHVYTQHDLHNTMAGLNLGPSSPTYSQAMYDPMDGGHGQQYIYTRGRDRDIYDGPNRPRSRSTAMSYDSEDRPRPIRGFIEMNSNISNVESDHETSDREGRQTIRRQGSRPQLRQRSQSRSRLVLGEPPRYDASFPA